MEAISVGFVRVADHEIKQPSLYWLLDGWSDKSTRLSARINRKWWGTIVVLRSRVLPENHITISKLIHART